MMWLDDLLPAEEAIRPTCPTREKHVGRPQTVVTVGPSDTSDTSDTKKRTAWPKAEKRGNPPDLKIKNDSPLYKNGLSVRHDTGTEEAAAHQRVSVLSTPPAEPLPHAAAHPWPVLDALNRTYRCTALPEGGGIVLYPAAGLTAGEKADALRFARDNLPALLKDLCLEHLPRRVRLESGRREDRRRGAV